MHHRYEEVSTGASALKGMGNELRKLSTSALNGRKTLLLECLRDLEIQTPAMVPVRPKGARAIRPQQCTHAP